MSTTTSPKASASAPARLPAGTGRPLPLWYSVTLGGFVAVATSYGLLTRPYRLVSDLLSATWVAQDAVTLLVVPVLVWSAQRAAAGSLRAHLLWIGVQTWITYCYLHLAFGAPFNAMFLVYVVVLGLAGYGMLDGIVRLDVVAAARALAPAPQRAAAWFLAIGGVGIAGLWLSDIVPALIASDLPTEIHLGELANPTWVIDLAWIIPLSIGTAMSLARRHPAGPALAATLLIALLLLSLAMLAIAPTARSVASIAPSMPNTPEKTASWVATAVSACSPWASANGAMAMQPEAGPWLRRGWWTWR